MTTSSRLLTLLSLLQARRDWPGGLLAERLDVSPRTVRRDVDRLRGLGYPVEAFRGPDGGYRLAAGTELPPLLFDDDQAVAVAVALRLAALSGAGIAEAAVRALTTVRQVMPPRLRHRIDDLELTAIPPASAPRVDSSVLTTLSAAVRSRETIRFDYAEAEPAAPPRRAEPHHLVARSGRWYLVAWDPDRADWRIFRVDRMRLRIPNGPRFTPREVPGGDVATFVTGRFRGALGTTQWPCRGEVVIDLPAGDVSAHEPDGVVEPLGPDRSRLTTGSWSWIGLAAALGRFDAELEVVGPVELTDACAALAARYARAVT
ncbi:helix-turn-helix transcriptional regulator [Aeromicrobium wangtongii]|uniref:helix-turn-helix transcriptional regulator n=1 Tax=Aeromicrobium wangtongii TaxID=2969247 RepID=UPI002017B89D|nr:WYL domain-containing protein [Aeromicrobium wangtongii]MCL3820052.1 WYL domain-containing protein [Aeromicrobium wangtongii]